MAAKTTIKKRLVNMEEQDERALVYITRKANVGVTGAIRLSLRITEAFLSLDSDRPVSDVMKQVKALNGPSHLVNKNLRRVKRK